MSAKSDIDCDRQGLSGLVDGQWDDAALDALLDEAVFERTLQCWRDYHVAGDLLRAKDLAPTSDAAWFEQLRERLHAEPQQPAVQPLAPKAHADAVAQLADDDALTRQPAANDSVFRWKMVAGLASFAAVAAVGWSVLGALPQGTGPTDAVLVQNDAAPAVAGAPQQLVSAPQWRTTTPPWHPQSPPYSVVLRSPELDRLLAAQNGAGANAAVQPSHEFFRSAGYGATER